MTNIFLEESDCLGEYLDLFDRTLGFELKIEYRHWANDPNFNMEAEIANECNRLLTTIAKNENDFLTLTKRELISVAKDVIAECMMTDDPTRVHKVECYGRNKDTLLIELTESTDGY